MARNGNREWKEFSACKASRGVMLFWDIRVFNCYEVLVVGTFFISVYFPTKL